MKNQIRNFDKFLEEIEEIELELTGTCNLSCPLCARNNPEAKDLLKKNHRPLNNIIKQIESYRNLKRICLAGIISEPTLYKDFKELIIYLGTTNLSIELYTNASIHPIQWWEELGKIFPNNIKIFFTVCGSTQELHSKYRVGSKLQTVLDNAKAFKEYYRFKNDYIQHIKFKYNEEDFNSEAMQDIIKRFNNTFLINSLPYNERFSLASEEFDMPKNSKFYTNLKNITIRKIENQKQKILCKAKQTNFLSIDQYGNATPCFLFRMYKSKEFIEKDYNDIDNGKFNFCYECDKTCGTLLKQNNLEQMA
jgi:MoaA/NifB/PqqE/SkfB family radical SAM enzyme